ncbi:endonuclease NucS [Halorubrum ezzemoulense]|uniref:endonuclease NucS n=1 Tax=Halorubrum ezzemoulense TaxID=337243 RepID=UPI00232BE1B4|nr:endonuclease NucS [Halorubrum ezzemoulense]MDB9249588.1 endonuclease NucS [Halorubrum ezzemoulense]MDB9259378.1 endonuclease NucS [Halorubrum ezzemoulense]MDB9263963.1 endonuclease NucS [Halorubrum ezzemoulense]MDB9266727.1 endonuclease NucS [Halorubrum ezzemoulense]MDB9269739.1 endonuclease NucS [Halorubrum ezzemoulense]
MTVTSVHDPSHREALWELEDAFERGDLISVFGRCTVSYEGRAASDLGAGDRLLVLKPDGAALVHTDEGRQPVNWQPPGSEHRAAVREGRLRVRSTRSNPDETLTVRFAAVDQLSAMAVTGGRDLTLHGSEEDLRTRILERPDLVEPGFEPRETERPSSAGPMDVFGVDADGTPVVVELKRRRVGPDAVGQLARYVRALREELGIEANDGETDDETASDGGDDETDDADSPEVRGILVAPSVTDRAAERLAERGFDHVALEPTPEE